MFGYNERYLCNVYTYLRVFSVPVACLAFFSRQRGNFFNNFVTFYRVWWWAIDFSRTQNEYINVNRSLSSHSTRSRRLLLMTSNDRVTKLTRKENLVFIVETRIWARRKFVFYCAKNNRNRAACLLKRVREVKNREFITERFITSSGGEGTKLFVFHSSTLLCRVPRPVFTDNQKYKYSGFERIFLELRRSRCRLI